MSHYLYVFWDKFVNYLYNGSPRVFRIKQDKPWYQKIGYCMAKIDDTIYLGNAVDAANYTWLHENEIDCVVNATKEISNYYPDYFTYLRIPVDDTNDEDLTNHFDDFLEFVRANQGKRILVHCYMGSSRSASLVLVYLCKMKGMSVSDALNLLTEKRDIVNPNTSFVEQIYNYLNETIPAESIIDHVE